ncbi:enhancer of polycomb-like-domain-containing protein [Pseudomassariella vexata]|uniref:Enhancer of polycomb-like protein n=1 Tax=Pseudomassariella vexata TaxID=1141098 RepID=A0A1Y2EIW6_9PEZI|nr:enhancer of polycomb-like-domain-containing protein [Pseudomassariella vexata]ORY71264.1 enhancer of polycomb-like-domain-containing protein [Pseudomassariella vexata]
MSTRKPVRIRKLNTKTALQVLREDQIDRNEYDSLTTDAQIATGVESNEEQEIHLQAVLKGAGASTDNEIPVPPPQESDVSYDELYSTPYIEPRNYIRFSDTVEETLGSLYDMTTEDEEYLKTYNAKRASKLSDDDFERIMELFEMTASEQTPYAAVDNTIVPYEVMVQHMAHSPVVKLQTHTKQVYEYWKTRRQDNANKPLHPSLKFETHQEHDDLDPYVCFRRREVRQTRKTRARDVQIADKLKKLRRELEDGRQLVLLSHQREVLKKELLNTERFLFEHRAKLKERKVRLGIKADDEDLLYNTKPQKRKISEVQHPVRGAPHQRLSLPVPRESRAVEQDLVQLSDKQKEQYAEFFRDIESKAQHHRHWNNGHIDLTERPLSPVKEEQHQNFRPAKAVFLPTPPASASESMELDDEPVSTVMAPKRAPSPFVFNGADESESTPTYRRRVGRNGRLWIDRRHCRLASPPSDTETPPQSDQCKYDQDDSEDEQAVYHIDQYSTSAMRFRTTIPAPGHRYPRGHVADANAPAHPVAVSRPALPPVPAPAPPQPSNHAQPQPQPQPT